MSQHVNLDSPSNDTAASAATENDPLLIRTTSIDSNHTRHNATVARHHVALRVSVICIIAILFVEVGDAVLQAPSARVIEDIICRDYYSSSPPNSTDLVFGSIPESQCKNEAIQGKLAMLRGLNQMFSGIPGLLTAVPFGALADRIGRRPVLVLSLFGLSLSIMWSLLVCYFDNLFDLRWYWASNVFLFIGGGSPVARVVFYAIIADVVAEKNRAAVFFQVMASSLIANLVGVPLAWWLMKTSVWIPLLLSQVFMLLGALLVLVLPETLHYREHHHDQRAEDSDAQSSDNAESLSFSVKHWRTLLDTIEESRFVFTNPNLLMLAITFLTTSLHGNSNQFLIQLASKRLNWTLAEASFLMPVSSITNFTLLVVVLPAIYAILTKLRLQITVRDLIVGRTSAILLALGSFGIALSAVPSLFIMSTVVTSLGMGFIPATRSLITSLVHPSQVSRLYGVMAVFDTIGGMVSSPLMSGAFSSGLKKGGLWSGGAFLVAGIAYAGAGLLMSFVDVKRDEPVEDDAI